MKTFSEEVRQVCQITDLCYVREPWDVETEKAYDAIELPDIEPESYFPDDADLYQRG